MGGFVKVSDITTSPVCQGYDEKYDGHCKTGWHITVLEPNLPVVCFCKLSVATFDGTLTWVVATETLRPAKLKILSGPLQKKAFHDPGSKGSVCEGPGELQGRRAEPAQQGWRSKPYRANVELALKDDLLLIFLGSRNPLHKGMRIPGMFQKMSCSLYGGGLQCTGRKKVEKSGWVNGLELEFLFYRVEDLKLDFM